MVACIGTTQVRGNAEADIKLSERNWLSVKACMGRDLAALSAQFTQAVASIRFNGKFMSGPPGPDSFRGTIVIR